ncbi:Virulence transcriptional regulatory protein PhoP [uncultured Defluviicoccus sp.]|uniref:Virulence transcriptional regulatory protein PhoP n=1 Tax=metagenome TaxID=256318 RepID=A0A380TES5_9ZZZZ|nr:Virulence transcriptional regulatory protein PhoP [uncultured Defluviicoccus sp.]SUS08482.1 Virulence transcriptional regulatory protein PhoP [uncultured Defluviicoccus sp.]
MRVLIVEDDPSLRRQLCDRLTAEGYAIDTAADGEEAAFQGETEPYDAIILDLGLPRQDGLSVLRGWRESGLNTPVMILTARDHWHDKVLGIDAGADDYLAKPFHVEELLARLRALIRRAQGRTSAELRAGPVVLDTRTGEVTASGQPVELTAYELRVLSYLMHHVGEIVSRTELTEHVYAQDFDRDSNTIEVFVGRLRKKLGVDLIKTVRGLGYRFDPAPDDSR